jgi:hypothetical protein
MGLLKSVLNYFAPEEEKPVQSPGRNEQCWCGSGRKYKHCHLHEDEKKLKNYSANCLNG